MDGHYIRGYGDRSKEAQVFLLTTAEKEAREFLAHEQDKESLERLNKVSQIIEGFETPYGLELLATVHWTIKEDPSINLDPNKVIDAVHQWSIRKQKMFKPQHIYKAWEHLNKSNIFQS